VEQQNPISSRPCFTITPHNTRLPTNGCDVMTPTSRPTSSGRSSLQLPRGKGPLDPRDSSSDGLSSIYYPAWGTFDPRTSSTQSLAASLAPDEQRRTLLLIYIHGFMGNDSSFRSFPAHIHAFLKESLAETHVIHSKIYPRYKTYKAIDVARDNFSTWLEPHESPVTDVVLVGHSMGGLLAAEVALLVRSPCE
jgi:acetyl esterase/lipase